MLEAPKAIQATPLNITVPKVVFYHDQCADGFAAFVAFSISDAARKEDYVPIPFSYADTDIKAMASALLGKTIYFLDCCPKAEDLYLLLGDMETDVIVLDHHATSEWIRKIDTPNFQCSWASEMSGAGLAWDWFVGNEPPPFAISLIQDRDLWQFKFEGSKAFHAGIMAEERSVEVWERAFSYPHIAEEIIVKGKSILHAHQELAMHCADKSYGGFIELRENGIRVPTHFVNAPYPLVSETGEAVYSMLPTSDKAIVCLFSIEGSRVNYSLRQHKEGSWNCAQIAKDFGGGGHKNAAGFSVPLRLSHLCYATSGKELYADTGSTGL